MTQSTRTYRTALVGSFYCFLLCVSTASAVSPNAQGGGDEQIAVSLKALAQAAQGQIAKTDSICGRPEDMASMGWLEGYVVDPEKKDIILIGQRNLQRPHLQLGDLAVAMRTVWTKGEYPYCSLDPKPEDIRAIMAVMSSVAEVSSEEQLRQFRARLEHAWHGQQIRIGGVPRESRYAHVMVDADYYLKQIAQGQRQMPGFTSMIDRIVNDAVAAVRAGQNAPPVQGLMARFWFQFANGHPRFGEDQDIVWLNEATVALLTEHQHATTTGILFDAPGEAPYAAAFARDFTRKYSEAAAHQPIYADLENLFRLQAVLSAMHFRRAATYAGLDLSFYLHRYQALPYRTMPDEVPGLLNSREVRETRRVGNTIYQYFFFPLAMGGVSVETPLREDRFIRDTTGNLTRIRTAVEAGRITAGGRWCWSVTDATDDSLHEPLRQTEAPPAADGDEATEAIREPVLPPP